MNICKHCNRSLNPDWSFCDVCGTIANYEEGKVVNCELHPDCISVGFCVICGKPVCEACKNTVDGKIACSDTAHQLMIPEWKVICRPESEFEAESIVCNLKAGEIDAKAFSLHDHISTHELNENRILVYVEESKFNKAKALLLELNLIEQD